MNSPRRKNHAWMWFFAFIVVASVAVASFMIWFNSRQQLKPEQLEAAMQRWKEHGPTDYRMTYTKQIKDNPTETFVVTVRARKVLEVRMNGKPLRNEETQQPYSPGADPLQYHSMDRLLRYIETFMELDARAGKKNFTVATFDKHTGALETYIRSDRAARQSIRETVKVEPLPVE